MDNLFRHEERLCELVSALLADQPVGTLDTSGAELQPVLDTLEFFLPVLLRETDQHWDHDGFDNVLPKTIEKTGNRSLVLKGEGLLFSTYRYVPLNFFIELTPDGSQIAACECQGGEETDQSGHPFHVSYNKQDDPSIS